MCFNFNQLNPHGPFVVQHPKLVSERVITPRPRATAAMSERAALLGRDGDRPSSSRATRDRARARDDAYDVERARGEIDADDGARDAGDDARGGKTTRASDGAGRDARRRGRAACVALGAMVAVLGARARGTATGDARACAVGRARADVRAGCLVLRL